jgi:hypothetical protein
MRTDGRTDQQDEANSRFSQYCLNTSHMETRFQPLCVLLNVFQAIRFSIPKTAISLKVKITVTITNHLLLYRSPEDGSNINSKTYNI